jgi:hypothetical protein
MKYLSFSLWGDKPIYNIGTIRNAELWKSIYPDWQMIVYYDRTVPLSTIKKLKELDVRLVDMSSEQLYGMFWRFLASDIEGCEYAIFRDSDSRISLREKNAVNEWIQTKKTLHVMRDHPYHRIPCGNDRLGILGGMWGIKGNEIPMTEMINKYSKSKEHNYGNDQNFLKTIYSVFENDRCTHDDFFERKPFPTTRENGRFIGERIDEYENPVGDDYKLIN